MELAHMQFSLSGSSTIIGLENYQKMILNNNKHFTTLAAIPVSCITLDILNLEIHVNDEK